MKKTLLITAILGMCSPVLQNVSAQDVNDTQGSESVVESVMDEDTASEEVISEDTQVSEESQVEESVAENTEESVEETEETKLAFELPSMKIVSEFLSEVGKLPFANKIDTDNHEVVENKSEVEGEDSTFTLNLILLSELSLEDESALDQLYKIHTSLERDTLDSVLEFSTKDEATNYAEAIVSKGLSDGENLVHIDYNVDQPEAGKELYTVSFLVNSAQVKDGLKVDFGKDELLHLYDANDVIVGENPTDSNVIKGEVVVEESTETEAPIESSEEVTTQTPEETSKEDVKDEVVNSTEEIIEFETERKEDASLLKGTEKVVQEGVNGIKVIKSTQQLLNGSPVGQPVVSEEVVKDAVNQIIAVGTGEPQKSEDVKEEVIKFTVEERTNPNLKDGERNVVRKGVDGIKVIKTVTNVFNGEVIGKPVVSEEIKQVPVNEIVEIGTAKEDIKVETKEEAIPFESETRENPQVLAGERKVIQAGVDGIKTIKTTTPLLNGQPNGQPTVEEVVTKEPVKEIIEVGTGREEERVDTREEVIKFQTEERNTDTRKVGERVVIRSGVEGIKQITTTQKYFNGQPVGEPKVEEVVTREAISEIVEVGTNNQPGVVSNPNVNTGTTPQTPTATPGVTITPTGQTIDSNKTPGTVTTTAEYVSIARKHTVQAGDTLESIAATYNTTVDNIKSLNGLTNDYVYQGQILTVSEAMRVPVEEYIAVQGDTAQSIADRFGMSVADLQKLNNNDPLSYIQEGQVVKVIDLKKGFGSDSNSTSLTQDFKNVSDAAPLADKKYETPRQQEQVVPVTPIPETGESKVLGIAGLFALLAGGLLVFFNKKKDDVADQQ